MKTKEYKLPINQQLLLWITVFGFFIVLLGSYFKITHNFTFGQYSELFLGLGLIIHLVSLIIVINDIGRNPIRNKFMWYFGILVLGSIAVILYLTYRNAHLRVYKNQSLI